MKWYDDAIDKIEKGLIYTRKELTAILQANYPHVSDNSCNWVIADMIKGNKIVKVGYNKYQLRTDDFNPSEYTPKYSARAQQIIAMLREYYPDVKATVFETFLLNEFLPVEKHISENIIFLEVEKDSTLQLFRMLQEKEVPNLIYKPTKKDLCFLKVKNCVVITDMTSQAPVKCKNRQAIFLEKLLVDIFCDRLIKETYAFDDFKAIVSTAHSRYIIDGAKLTRYADRRNQQKQIMIVYPDLATDKHEQVMNKVNKATSIMLDAMSILITLPESQKVFFNCINTPDISQIELAKINHTSRQSITTRINRLYNTIIRRLVAEYGYDEEDIKKIFKGKKLDFIRAIGAFR